MLYLTIGVLLTQRVIQPWLFPMMYAHLDTDIITKLLSGLETNFNSIVGPCLFLIAKQYYESKNEVMKLEKEKKESELQLLRAQIDPHFLFNNLNILDILINIDPKKASLYTKRLSSLYRYMIKYLNTNGDPDLILSDIELLDGKVFKLYEQYEIQSPIIFTTAYDQYLLEAFQTNGIAYLLKPFSDEELKKALDKYLKLFKSKESNTLDQQVIEEFKTALMSSQKEYKKRFTIKKSSGIFLLNTSDIAYFSASDDLVFAIDVNKKKHVVNYRMADLEELLDPSMFFRINRSEMVNIHFIEKMEAYFGNRLVVTMKNDKVDLKTSGPKTSTFRKWVEGG